MTSLDAASSNQPRIIDHYSIKKARNSDYESISRDTDCLRVIRAECSRNCEKQLNLLTGFEESLVVKEPNEDHLLRHFKVNGLPRDAVETQFITSREVLQSVLSLSFGGQNERFVARKFEANGPTCIGLETRGQQSSIEPSDSLEDNYCRDYLKEVITEVQAASPRESVAIAREHDFHHYCVLENRIGPFSVLYSGKMDVVESKFCDLKDPQAYISIETAREAILEHPLESKQFHANLWAKCVLSGIEEVIVAFRDHNSVCEKLIRYRVEDLPEKFSFDAKAHFFTLQNFLQLINSCTRFRKMRHSMTIDLNLCRPQDEDYSTRTLISESFEERFKRDAYPLEATSALDYVDDHLCAPRIIDNYSLLNGHLSGRDFDGLRVMKAKYSRSCESNINLVDGFDASNRADAQSYRSLHLLEYLEKFGIVGGDFINPNDPRPVPFDFVTFHGPLVSMLLLRHSEHGREFVVQKFENTIYISAYRTQSQRDSENSYLPEEEHKKNIYSGEFFQQFITEPHSSDEGDDENARKHFNVFHNTIGPFSVLYSDKMDALESKWCDKKDPRNYIKLTTKRDKYITDAVPFPWREQLFRGLWADCVLSGTEELIVGYRDGHRVCNKIIKYRVKDLPSKFNSYTKNQIATLVGFLQFVKSLMQFKQDGELCIIDIDFILPQSRENRQTQASY